MLSLAIPFLDSGQDPVLDFVLDPGHGTTTQSHRSAIYYVDLTIREGMTLAEALQQARANAAEREESGFDQPALDEAAHQALQNGAFEESPDEGAEIMEEFYPFDTETPNSGEAFTFNNSDLSSHGLRMKLAHCAAHQPKDPDCSP